MKNRKSIYDEEYDDHDSMAIYINAISMWTPRANTWVKNGNGWSWNAPVIYVVSGGSAGVDLRLVPKKASFDSELWD